MMSVITAELGEASNEMAGYGLSRTTLLSFHVCVLTVAILVHVEQATEPRSYVTIQRSTSLS